MTGEHVGAVIGRVGRAAGVGLGEDGDPFVGRQVERSAVSALLSSDRYRLVTLTGPPGIGKTRPGVACAQDYAARRTAAAVFVDLVPLTDPDSVLGEVGRALGVSVETGGEIVDRLAAAVAYDDVLVLIDNCEHVLGFAPQLGRLLDACPQLHVLATSRERLRVRAEQEFPVPSLPTPSPGDAADLPTLTANASVALFVERAPRTNPGFEVTAAKAAAVSEACVRLEGLPLALELAAARLRVLTPGELVFRLDKRLGVLAGTTRDIPVRQRALSAAIAWSHDLLSAPERALFRRLSVFRGEWTVTDAEGVCGSELADVLGLVESLLDKSLIRRVACDADTATFAMLDSLRQFAAER